MHFTLCYIIHLLVAASVASAQSLVPTAASATFPACAVSCTVLLQAQQLCVPPAVAANSQISYENCFCQSSILQALYSTPDAICAAECTVESDRTLLQTWFTTFCRSVGQGIDPLATSTTVVVVTSTRSDNNPTSATITGSGSSSNAAPPSNQTWISGHWKWILMLAILIIGFVGLAALAVCLKRRHRRKVDKRRAAASGFPTSTEKRRDGARSATPDLWGPHQHMHATKGWEYDVDPGSSVASGGLGSSEKREHRRSRKDRNSRSGTDMSEVDARPAASRRKSSKGKRREGVDDSAVEENSRSTHESRSRSRRRREKDREKDPNRDIEQGLPGSGIKSAGRKK